MDDQQDGNPSEVEVVKYGSPWAPVSVFMSIVFLVIGIPILAEMLIGSIEASPGAILFAALFVILAGFGILRNPLAIGTKNEGLVLKYFPNRYQVTPWAEIRFLSRRGMFGRDLIIKRSRFFDLRSIYIYISPLTGTRQLELIDRLIAVICQQAKLSPKRKTLWGYDVYIRSDLQ